MLVSSKKKYINIFEDKYIYIFIHILGAKRKLLGGKIEVKINVTFIYNYS